MNKDDMILVCCFIFKGIFFIYPLKNKKVQGRFLANFKVSIKITTRKLPFWCPLIPMMWKREKSCFPFEVSVHLSAVFWWMTLIYKKLHEHLVRCNHLKVWSGAMRYDVVPIWNEPTCDSWGVLECTRHARAEFAAWKAKQQQQQTSSQQKNK